MKQAVKGKYGCAVCGKGVQHGNLVSFSKRKIKMIRKPNLHTHRMVVDGTKVKIKVCTSCKRALRVDYRVAQKTAAVVAA